jgi:hypothetical protein
LSSFEDSRKLLAEALAKGPESPQSFFAKLDAEDNELGVREALAASRYNSRRAALAEEWLRRKEDARQAEATSRAEALEDESLSIARSALSAATDANRIASEARDSAAAQARWAMWAAIIAAVAAVIATKDQMVALVISWLP